MKTFIPAAIAALTLVAGTALAGGHDQAAASEHAGHGSHGHSMSPEQMKALRKRIPLYDRYTDEQIMFFMGRMENIEGWMTSDERRWVVQGTREGKIGILALAHGFKEPGNTQFRAAFQEVAAEYPTTYALGMAMMTSDPIAAAIRKLEEAGAEKIIIMPVTTADNSSLTRQWDYIFGKIDEPAYLDTPVVKSSAELIWAPTPTASPIVADIMLAHAKELSTDPANETVVIMGHGPQSKEDNEKELAILAKHAAYIKSQGGFADVIFANVQDDAPPEVRAANVEAIRARAQAAADKGHHVIAVHTQLTQSSVVNRLKTDIGGIADLNPRGLTEHPRFKDWINEQIALAQN